MIEGNRHTRDEIRNKTGNVYYKSFDTDLKDGTEVLGYLYSSSHRRSPAMLHVHDHASCSQHGTACEQAFTCVNPY